MVDARIVGRRIAALLRYVDLLQPFRNVDCDTFEREPAQHDLAERYLHLAAEAAIDIANHLVADGGWGFPETYRAAFVILERQGVIPAELSARLQSWAGFRNILVHEYLDIDHRIAWDAIQMDLPDLEQLAAIAAELL